VRDGVPVAVTGGADNTVRIWNLRTGEQVGPPLTGHTDRVGAVAVVRSGDRTVLVTTAGGYQGATSEARFWDLATGAPLGAPLTGHPLSSAFLGQPGGEGSLLVAAGPGNPITVWDPAQLIPEVTS
jgi:WD40 repeat protein